MRPRIKMVLAALAIVVSTAPRALAQQEKETEVAAPAAEPPRIQGSFSLDWTTAYYFRGILQERTGLILQPQLTLGAQLYSGEGTITSARLTGGIWSSFHTGPTGQPATAKVPRAWYEADLFAQTAIGLADVVTLDVTYTAYTSPNGSFYRVHELSLGAAYSDAPLWASMMGGRFQGVSPSVRVAREIDGTAFGPDEGTYASVGLSPLVTILETSTLVLGAMMPLELGLGLGDYYEQDTDDDVFGYWRGALALKLGFPCVPPCFGTWALSGGAALLVLGDNTSDLAGRRAEVIGFASLSLSP